MQETLDNVKSTSINEEVTILSPECCDEDISNDEENIDDEDDLTEVEFSFDSDEENTQNEIISSKKSHFLAKTLASEELSSSIDEKIPELGGKSCYEIWELYFTNENLEDIFEKTRLYAIHDMNDNFFDFSLDDVRNFIGILIFSGYHFVTSESDYWSLQPDLKVPFVSETMSLYHFSKLKKYFQISSDQIFEGEHLVAKVETLYRSLNEKLCQWGVFHKKLSIGSCVVPYFDKHRVRTYVNGKTTNFGYKIWALCGEDGYPYHLDIHTGNILTERCMEPPGQMLVMDLLNVVLKTSEPQYHEIYFDNAFISDELLEILTENGFVLNKSFYEDEPNEFFEDVLSNTSEPVCKVPRYSKKHIKSEKDQSRANDSCKQGSMGIDLFNRKLASYRPKISTTKWWWPMMINMVNTSIVAAWKLHCALHAKDNKKVSHLDFRREIAIVLMKSVKSEKIPLGRLAVVPADVRYDHQDHEPVSCSQGRCVICRRNTRSKCGKCNQRLHYAIKTRCFTLYHTR